MASVSAVAFWTAKRGSREAEWEDHFGLDEELGRFAVADGASSSPKAAVWAQTLTAGFLADPFDLTEADDFDRWIERRCDQFRVEHPTTADEEVTPDNWYAQAAEKKDGFATLIAAQFDTSSKHAHTVTYVGVGDACLFHVRDGVLLASAPDIGAGGFGTLPDLISSNDDHRTQAVERVFFGTSEVELGDEVFLVSDALAEWALTTWPKEPALWSVFGDLDSVTFEALVSDLRDHDEIVNDDVTLVRCRVLAGRG